MREGRCLHGVWAAGGCADPGGADAVADGRAVITEEYPEGPIVGFEDSYTTFKDVIKFAGDGGGGPFTAHWKPDGNELHFTDISGRADDKYIWGHTWTRER